MKRLIVFAILLLTMGGVSIAQDTIYSPKPHWYYNYLIADSLNQRHFFSDQLRVNNCDLTKVFYTDRPMYIYGVAIALRSMRYVDGRWDNMTEEERIRLARSARVIDTSFNHSIEFVRAYELAPKGDTIKILREAVCGVRMTPKNCWYKLRLPPNLHVSLVEMEIVPIYEVYFDSPLWVSDSFYVGVSQYTHTLVDSAGVLWYQNWPLSVPARGIPRADIASNPILPYNSLISCEGDCIRWGLTADCEDTLNPERRQDFVMWPIVDSTMVGVAPPSVVQPEVSVSPNPTTGRATVVSEHELSHIEIINTQGEFVGYHSVSGTRAELDLTRYPTGIYFLHIYTEGGTVSRRVSVVR